MLNDCFGIKRWTFFMLLFCMTLQRPAEGFMAKKKSCSLDLARFRWLPVATYRRDLNALLAETASQPTWGYYPNYGYEPYWADGNWVLELNQTTITGEDYACGEFCHDMYYEYGEVCGRGRNYTHKTFDNYCQLLNEDCKGREKWLIAYRGPCQEDLKTRPTNQSALVERANKYLTDFEVNNPTTVNLMDLTVTKRNSTSTKKM